MKGLRRRFARGSDTWFLVGFCIRGRQRLSKPSDQDGCRLWRRRLTDIAARLVAEKMGSSRPDRSGREPHRRQRHARSEDVVKSPPDGYTLMMASQTVLAVAPKLYRKATLDPVKDFAAVAYCGASPLVLVVNPSFPAHTTAEMIAMAKADPGKIIFGTGGVGTTPHIASELFQYVAGIKMTHVPYRGEAGAINDLVAGQIPAMFANLSAVTASSKPALCGRLPSPVRNARRPARYPDGSGNTAGLRRRNLVRHRRAGGHAARRYRSSSTPRRSARWPMTTPKSVTPTSA